MGGLRGGRGRYMERACRFITHILCLTPSSRPVGARVHLLLPAELEALPRCVEPNPVNPAFTPMHLFRRAGGSRLWQDPWFEADPVCCSNGFWKV